ncbi:sterol-binding protein [Pseudonocardiaceae bacterium YIM PH 21723]|nr:sterol-binding protein [Pseudonocardiaceae bacterium YIM PH 21723]
MLSKASAIADSGESVDLSSLGPAEFAKLVSRASKDQIEAVLGVPSLKKGILTEIFNRMEEQFRPERAANTNAIIHWRLSDGAGEGGYDRYETVIADGRCVANIPPQHEEARVSITASPYEFLKLVSGNGSPPVMFMTGKIKLKGDLGLAAGLTNLFDFPKA